MTSLSRPPLRPHFHVWHAAAIVASCIPHPLLSSPLVCCSRGCRASTSVAAAVVYSRLPLLLPIARRSRLRISAIAAPMVATVNEVVRFHGHHGRGRRRPREHPVLASKSPAWRSPHPLVFIATVYLLPPPSSLVANSCFPSRSHFPLAFASYVSLPPCPLFLSWLIAMCCRCRLPQQPSTTITRIKYRSKPVDITSVDGVRPLEQRDCSRDPSSSLTASAFQRRTVYEMSPVYLPLSGILKSQPQRYAEECAVVENAVASDE